MSERNLWKKNAEKSNYCREMRHLANIVSRSWHFCGSESVKAVLWSHLASVPMNTASRLKSRQRLAWKGASSRINLNCTDPNSGESDDIWRWSYCICVSVYWMVSYSWFRPANNPSCQPWVLKPRSTSLKMSATVAGALSEYSMHLSGIMVISTLNHKRPSISLESRIYDQSYLPSALRSRSLTSRTLAETGDGSASLRFPWNSGPM